MKDIEDRNFYCAKMSELVTALIGAVLLMTAMGCSAGKMVSSETVTAAVKRDSSAAVRTDTVWRDRFVERIVERVKKEATSVRDSTVFTVDKEGNVIKAEHWRGEKTMESSEETERLRDSAAMWKARYEALLVVKADSVAGVKETIVKEEKNTRPGWHWWNVVAFVMMGVVAVVAVVRDYWRRGHGG